MKKQMRSMTAITWLLILSIMGTWLLSMISLTVVTAQEIYDTLYRESDEFSSYVRRCSKLNDYFENTSEYCILASKQGVTIYIISF